MGTNPWVHWLCAGKWYGSNIQYCIYASRKVAQGWVWFISASRRLGAILGRSQGLLRCVDVEGVAWEVMWKHNKSEFQRGLMYFLGLVFPQINYWLALSQSFHQPRIVSQSSQSHPTASK